MRFASLCRPANARGCIEWTGATSIGGAPTFTVWENGKLKLVLARRHLWMRLHGSAPPSVRTTCSNPLCVAPAHLDGRTTAERHAAAMTPHQQRKRNAADIVASPKVLAEFQSRGHWSKVQLAVEYGISERQVAAIWQHHGRYAAGQGPKAPAPRGPIIPAAPSPSTIEPVHVPDLEL